MVQSSIKGKERTQYSDEELAEFRDIILGKLTKAKEDLGMLIEAVQGNPNDTMGTSPTFKVLEEGFEVKSKEENSTAAFRQEKFIQSLENALVRIENKTYGICHETGKLIPKERLCSVPHTNFCIEAKLKKAKVS